MTSKYHPLITELKPCRLEIGDMVFNQYLYDFAKVIDIEKFRKEFGNRKQTLYSIKFNTKNAVMICSPYQTLIKRDVR